MRIELAIITGLLESEDFLRKAGPFISKDYFSEYSESVIIDTCLNFYETYNSRPTKDILYVELANRKDLSDDQLNEAVNIVESSGGTYDAEWLMTEAESFCKRKALVNAIYESIHIAENKDKSKTVDSIPKILEDALSVSFDKNVGHDYFDDMMSRYEFYHRVEEKLPFDIEILNKITDGGLSKKTILALLAPTGVGKSLVMCHMAASNIRDNRNVLYITMEMAEERIAERVDANLFNVPIQDIKHMSAESYTNKVTRIQDKTKGKLVIKEYPTGAAHAGHFRALLEELKSKKDFKPDVIYIDYLNICASQRVKNTSANSYTIVKSIAEELRGLAMEYDLPVVTATQVTRGGLDSSDLDMSDTSDSIGLAYTLDLFLALISTDELHENNQIIIKQLKNRYGDINFYKRFVVGIDRSRMKLYNVEESAQDDLTDKGKHDDDKPLFDKSSRKPDFGSFKF